MSFSTLLIIFITLAIIVGGIMVLKKSAKKFNLTNEQLKDIELRKKEQNEKDYQNK